MLGVRCWVLVKTKTQNLTPNTPPKMADKDETGRDAYEREVTTDLKDTTPDRPKGMPLHTRILIGLLVGVIAGVAANRICGGDHPDVAWTISHITEPIGTLFLRLLLMIVVPLVFSSLVVGVAGIGDIRQLGRVGLKAFGYTLVISAISVVIGLTLANTIRPGERLDAETRAGLEARYRRDADEARGRRDEGGHDRLAADAGRQDHRAVNPVASVAGIIAGEEKQTDTPEHAAPDVLRAAARRRRHARPHRGLRAAAARLAGALRNLGEDHRHHHEARAVRGRVPALQQHGALRARPAAARSRGSW